MKRYTLSAENYRLLKSIDFSEMGNTLILNEKENSFKTSNIRLLEIIITEEIATKGMDADQELCNEYGRKLYNLYDEIYYQ